MVTCPYCSQPAVFKQSSAHLYRGYNYGPVWECEPCGAYVGCHDGTDRPLGRLANAELRKAKIQAHASFDPIWMQRFERKAALDPKYTKGMARGGRYKKLAELMGLKREECHIGMFDVQQCRKVIELCDSGALDE